jgi:large subunit ribosomal protein L17
MPAHRKLGRATDLRLAILKGLVTTLIIKGKVKTTEARAQEVSRIAEKLITSAVREKDNFSTRGLVVSHAQLDGKGRKVLKSVTSKNGKKYDVVTRDIKTDMSKVDEPSRLAARRAAMKWLNKSHDENGQAINPVNILFDTVAPKYEERQGGYTRVTKIGQRRGDAAEMAIVELI